MESKDETAQRTEGSLHPDCSALTEDVARAAWMVLNHDNSPDDVRDPCHAANWKTLKREIAKVLRAHRRKAQNDKLTDRR